MSGRTAKTPYAVVSLAALDVRKRPDHRSELGSQLLMGDYFDLAADLYGLPRPPRIARDAAGDPLPLVLLSFMSESRRLHNQRMKAELRLSLRYPTGREGRRS